MGRDIYGNETPADSFVGPTQDDGAEDVFGGSRSPEQASYLMSALASVANDPNAAIPSLMQANPDQPGIDRTRQMAQMLQGMTAPDRPAPVKMPWWGYALGGLADLGSFLSYKHRSRPRNVEIGRNEFGGRMHARIRPDVAPPKMGGLATALFAPMAINRRQNEMYQHEAALNRRAAIPGIMNFAARTFAPPRPAAPPAVPPLQQTLTVLDQQDPTGAMKQTYLRKFIADSHGSQPDKLKTAQEWKDKLDEIERTKGKAARQDIERIAGIAALQKGTPKPPKPGEAGLTASEKRLIDIRQAPIKEQIKTLQRSIDALRRSGLDDPDTEAALQGKIDHLTEALDYAARGTPGVGRKLWGTDQYGGSEEETPAEDTGEGGLEEGGSLPLGFNPYDSEDSGMSGGAVPPTSAIPPGADVGFDPQDPAIRATPMGDGTIGDYLDRLHKMTPDEQQEVGRAIRAALGIGG